MIEAWKNIIFYHKAGSETIFFTTSPQNTWDRNFDARGAPAGLYPHRLVQGTPGAGRDYPAHPQKCPHSGGDPDRPAVADPGGGAVIMENIFNLPGIGRLLVNALNDRDYPMVSGVNLFFATAVMVINLLIDLIYAFLDPRVRYE